MAKEKLLIIQESDLTNNCPGMFQPGTKAHFLSKTQVPQAISQGNG